MSQRQERAAALQTLYSLYFTPIENEERLREIFLRSREACQPEDGGAPPELDFAWRLIRGAWENKAELDALIEKFSPKQNASRLGKLERALLSLALFETLHTDTEFKIIRSEAMRLADEFNAAKHIVGGALDAAAKDLQTKAKA